MARRRLNLRGTIDTERHSAALDRHLRRMTAPPSQSPEDAPQDASDGPKGVAGTGGAATGFGRRAIAGQYKDVVWDPDVPYPQMDTRSSNPERPRTLEAGYDSGNQILRITFREGAVYEYLGVPDHTWETFRRAPSPGRMVDDVLNQFFYRRID